MCFHYFLLIFMIFSFFFNKHEQTSWFQTMDFIKSTHAKLIRALVGARHSWHFLRYCLLDIWLIFDSSWWYTYLFRIYCWASLVFHRLWMLVNQVCFFYPPILKFYECECYHEPCLMSYLIVLMLVWSSLIECMSWVIFLN